MDNISSLETQTQAEDHPFAQGASLQKQVSWKWYVIATLGILIISTSVIWSLMKRPKEVENMSNPKISLRPTLSNPSPVPDEQIREVESSKIYSNKLYNLTFSFPKDWVVNKDTQIFSSDLVTVEKWGETQKANTEFADGIRFVVMTPLSTEVELSDWIQKEFIDNSISDPPIITREIISGIPYSKIHTCGLGCHDFYVTKNEGRIFAFILFPDNAALKEVLSSVSFAPIKPLDFTYIDIHKDISYESTEVWTDKKIFDADGDPMIKISNPLNSEINIGVSSPYSTSGTLCANQTCTKIDTIDINMDGIKYKADLIEGSYVTNGIKTVSFYRFKFTLDKHPQRVLLKGYRSPQPLIISSSFTSLQSLPGIVRMVELIGFK